MPVISSLFSDLRRTTQDANKKGLASGEALAHNGSSREQVRERATHNVGFSSPRGPREHILADLLFGI